MSVNKAIIMGNIGTEPEVRFTAQGVAVANFSVATNEKWTDKAGKKQEHTEWHRIVAWDKKATFVQEYFHKGSPIYLEGTIKTREYEKDGAKRYSTEITANEIRFVPSAGRGDKSKQPAQADIEEPPF